MDLAQGLSQDCTPDVGWACSDLHETLTGLKDPPPRWLICMSLSKRPWLSQVLTSSQKEGSSTPNNGCHIRLLKCLHIVAADWLSPERVIPEKGKHGWSLLVLKVMYHQLYYMLFIKSVIYHIYLQDPFMINIVFLVALMVKILPAMRETSLIPRLGRSPGGGNGNPL